MERIISQTLAKRRSFHHEGTKSTAILSFDRNAVKRSALGWPGPVGDLTQHRLIQACAALRWLDGSWPTDHERGDQVKVSLPEPGWCFRPRSPGQIVTQ